MTRRGGGAAPPGTLPRPREAEPGWAKRPGIEKRTQLQPGLLSGSPQPRSVARIPTILKLRSGHPPFLPSTALAQDIPVCGTPNRCATHGSLVMAAAQYRSYGFYPAPRFGHRPWRWRHRGGCRWYPVCSGATGPSDTEWVEQIG
jgi:hypothetical protein